MQADTGALLPGGDFARHDVDPDRALLSLVAIDKRPYLWPRYPEEAQYVAPTLLAAIRDATYSLIALHQQYNVVTLKKPLDHCVAQPMRKLNRHCSLRDRHNAVIRQRVNGLR
jgi:hypothetical protein